MLNCVIPYGAPMKSTNWRTAMTYYFQVNFINITSTLYVMIQTAEGLYLVEQARIALWSRK